MRVGLVFLGAHSFGIHIYRPGPIRSGAKWRLLARPGWAKTAANGPQLKGS